MALRDESSTPSRRGRSTTGCANCKLRKVKCDERKPTCLRCQDRRLRCPGYPKVVKWSYKHEPRKPGNVQSPTAHTQLSHEFAVALSTSPSPDPIESFQEAPISGLYSIGHGSHDDHSGLPQFPPVSLYAADTDMASSVVDVESSATIHGAESPPNDQNVRLEQLYPLQEGQIMDDPEVNDEDITYDDGDEYFLGTAFGAKQSSSCREVALMPTSNITGNLDVHSPFPSLLHIPTLLVEYYFRKVCRDCSTFDSSANPFRSGVSHMQHRSASLHYTIQSLAAAKLADELPSMKIIGIEARGKALQTLKGEIATVSTLSAVSDEVLYTLLLLGMTTSWHAREDLGLQYLNLAHRVIAAKARLPPNTWSSERFFRLALMYWTMIASLVSGDIDPVDMLVAEISVIQRPPSLSLLVKTNPPKIMPHPWAGIAPWTLELFGQVLQLIRKTRKCSSRITSANMYSRAEAAGIIDAIATAEALELKSWSMSIPSVDQLEETGDTHTPRLDHVYTARAYLLSALLQIYMVFPDVLEARIGASGEARTFSPLPSSISTPCQDVHTNPHIISQSTLWRHRSVDDHRDDWLKDVAMAIVQCLENITWKSSTRVIHPPLLLSISSALKLSAAGGDMDASYPKVSNGLIRRSRKFLVDRLEKMQNAMRFHAIDNILQVINEVWRRSDVGRQDLFWMDVMSELHCESIFG